MVYRPSQEKIEQNIVTELMGHAGRVGPIVVFDYSADT